KLVSPPEASSYFLLYKPVGVVTTLSDPQGRPTVAGYIEQTGKRLFPVGRLDYDAEGALLITDDGELAHKLTHPSFQVPRTYLAKVKGTPDEATLEKLRGGVRLEDGMATPLSVNVFEQVERNTWLKLVVAEGRPHLIKRLCAAVGYPVVRLYRPSYAGVSVESVRPGDLRPLTASEVRLLQEVAEGRATPQERELKLPPRRHGRSAPGFEGEGAEDEDFIEAAAQARSRMAGKPARKIAKPERPARAAGRPERKAWAPRGEERPARAPRSAAGRPERKAWSPRGEERPERAPRSTAGRPERREWTPREDRAPRAATGRPERKAWAPREERGARPGPPRGEGGMRPVRKTWGTESAESRPARKTWTPASEGTERPTHRATRPTSGRPAGGRPAGGRPPPRGPRKGR
ncbi:MAG TPA: pseudouridine synthase, partial [Myxococcaceae bacterium]|nr:pseudouridine synthase [Myxococcaceae bacterium]